MQIEGKPIKLSSITDFNQKLEFNWSINNQEKRSNYGNDIVDLISHVCIEYPLFEEYFDKNLLKLSSIERKNYEIISKLCVEYNKSIENFKIRDKTVPNQDDNSIFLKNKTKKVSSKFVKFIMQLIYNKAICDPDKLNQYEPFSPQVYGETSFDLITEMIKRVPLTENDIFIDLGSGVGNVVLQVAALSNCKLAFGIEKAEWPAKYAKSMEDEFRLVMNWFGKKFSNCQLYNGDFLHDSDPNVNLKEMINEAKLIFVNNYAFGAEVDHQLKLRFSNMTEGAIIVSSKAFRQENFRINCRNLNDIGAILNTTEFAPICGHVSWTDKPVKYYFQKIDHTLLEKYFESLKNPKIKDESGSDSNHKNGGSNKRSNSTTDDEYDESEERNDEENNKSPKLKSRKNSKKFKNEGGGGGGGMIPNEKKKDKTPKSDKKPALGTNNSSKVTSPTNGSNKSFDKNVLNTLTMMHKQSVKASSIEGASKITSDTVGSDFNVKKMTKMVKTNIDCKLLKDCPIMDVAEYDIREQLGPEVSNAVDEYLKLYKKQILNYLLYMKMPQYFELIKKQMANEMKIRNEIIKKTDLIEKQISSFSSSSVTLLKKRVIELGLKEIQTPKDLIDFATTILGNHQELLNQVNNLQKSVDSLQNQNENLVIKNSKNI